MPGDIDNTAAAVAEDNRIAAKHITAYFMLLATALNLSVYLFRIRTIIVLMPR